MRILKALILPLLLIITLIGLDKVHAATCTQASRLQPFPQAVVIVGAAAAALVSHE